MIELRAGSPEEIRKRLCEMSNLEFRRLRERLILHLAHRHGSHGFTTGASVFVKSPTFRETIVIAKSRGKTRLTREQRVENHVILAVEEENFAVGWAQLAAKSFCECYRCKSSPNDNHLDWLHLVAPMSGPNHGGSKAGRRIPSKRKEQPC
jgi:hypothetical protein